MTEASTMQPSDHPIIRCVLELRYDGTIAIVARDGCTDHDIRDTLRLLADAVWPGEPRDYAQ